MLSDQSQQEILRTVGRGHVVETTIGSLPAASDEILDPLFVTREMRVSQAEKRSLAAQLRRALGPDPLGTASSKQVEQIM